MIINDHQAIPIIRTLAGEAASLTSKKALRRKKLPLNKFNLSPQPVQCFAGYCDVKYGHLLEGEKQKGVIVNTCKEFNLLPPQKGDPLIRATPPT